jgi:addiction module RelB/DinJ family antitoxin
MNETVRARIDRDIKIQAEKVLKSYGLNLSVAIRMYLTAIAKDECFKL